MMDITDPTELNELSNNCAVSKNGDIAKQTKSNFQLLATFGNDSSEYQQCLIRLLSHQKKLYSNLELIDFNLGEFGEFYQEFKTTIDESKIVTEQQLNQKTKNNAENPLLLDEFDELLSKLTVRQQILKLIKLLRGAKESVHSLESLYAVIDRDYKKVNIDALLANFCLLKQFYLQIFEHFNLYLLAKIDNLSSLYLYFYHLIEDWKDKLSTLTQNIFLYTFSYVKWPLITLEDAGPIPEKNLALFCELFRFLIELETGDFRRNGQPIKDNLVKDLECFRNCIDAVCETIETDCVDIEETSVETKQYSSSQCQQKQQFHIPIKLMATPLIKRFNFYFIHSQSKLNSIENPEWYLCQVEQWITKNENFLNKNIDPILEEYFGKYCKSAMFQLTCHLLELVKAKLAHDISQLTEDRLLSLTLDEVIIFNKQINFIEPGIFEFNPNLNPIRIFFDNENYFQRFLQLERNRLNEFIETIFESDTSWNIVYGFDSSDDNKFIICEAADKFSLLLQNLIERSTFIPNNEYRIRIIDLIMEIMDDFRLRLSQLIHGYEERWPFSDKFFSILNTFDFLAALIKDWQNNSYFIQILTDNNRDSAHFANYVKTFEHIIEEIFVQIENNIIADVTRDIIEYKKLNWHSMSIDDGELKTSKAGANLIYNISAKNSVIKRSLSCNLFHTFLYDIASKIQDLFFDRIIMEHYFNKDSARQLHHDITYGLFIIFSLDIKNSAYTFSKLSDALLLLNCTSSTCRKIQNSLKSDSEIEFRALLRNIGIYSLKPKTVLDVIGKRIGFN